MEEIILFLSVIFYKEIAQIGHSLTILQKNNKLKLQ